MGVCLLIFLFGSQKFILYKMPNKRGGGGGGGFK